MVMVHSLGLMVQLMKVNLMEIRFKDLVIIGGMMVKNMKVHGKTTKCMVGVFLHGLMEENMMDNTPLIKNQDMVSIVGVMVEFTRVNGKMGSRMVLEHF